jgi:potassium channel subfamily K
VLERGKVKVMRRTVELERQKWIARMDEPDAGWKKDEWEIMRRIQRRAETIRKYSALGSSSLAFLVLWFLGAMVFWFSEVRAHGGSCLIYISLRLQTGAAGLDVLCLALL